MQKSGTVKILKTLSSKELKDFRKFINSPFHNNRKSVVKFFNILAKAAPEYDSPLILKEVIFKKLFGNKNYNDNLIRVNSHYLNELLEKFLAVNRFINNKIDYNLMLADEMATREMYKQFDKNISVCLKLLDSEKPEGEIVLFQRFRIENSIMQRNSIESSGIYEKLKAPIVIDKVFSDLKKYFAYKTVILFLQSKIIRGNYGTENVFADLENSFNLLKIDDYSDTPVILLYYYLAKMLSDISNESYFYKVKELMSVYGKEFNLYDKTGVYVNLSNYCIRKVLDGFDKFDLERFEIYKEELKEKTYLNYDGTMSPVFYRNVTGLGLQLKEYEWTKNFIYEYKHELTAELRENYSNFCLAQYEFQMKNFETSLELNSKLKHDELYLKIYSKILNIQNLYELKYFDTLDSSIESFRHFISNNKLIPTDRKINFTNFFKYLNKIISVQNKTDSDEISLLRIQLMKESAIAQKSWLVEKVNELS